MTSRLHPRCLHRGRRLLAVLAVGVLALAAAACVPLDPPPPPPVAQVCLGTPPSSAAAYQQAFDSIRSYNTEWVAGDGALPVDLQDGRRLWLFSDTIVGSVRSNGSVIGGWRLVNNSFVLQQGACFAPFAAGGGFGGRTEAIPDPAGDQWYWPTGGFVEDDGAGHKLLRVFALHMAREANGSGSFEFKVLDVQFATFSLPSLAFQGVSALPFATTPPSAPMYGEAVDAPGDGYVYIYGHPGTIIVDPARQYVARRPFSTPGGPWEFFDAVSNTWMPSAAAATPMFFDDPTDGDPTDDQTDGPFDALSVIPYGTGYLAAAKPGGAFSTDVVTWSGPTPAGPWTKLGQAVNGLANDIGGTFTYGGHVVTEPLGGTPMLIWSQNRVPLDEVIWNSWWYRTFYAVPTAGSIPP